MFREEAILWTCGCRYRALLGGGIVFMVQLDRCNDCVTALAEHLTEHSNTTKLHSTQGDDSHGIKDLPLFQTGS